MRYADSGSRLDEVLLQVDKRRNGEKLLKVVFSVVGASVAAVLSLSGRREGVGPCLQYGAAVTMSSNSSGDDPFASMLSKMVSSMMSDGKIQEMIKSAYLEDLEDEENLATKNKKGRTISSKKGQRGSRTIGANATKSTGEKKNELGARKKEREDEKEGKKQSVGMFDKLLSPMLKDINKLLSPMMDDDNDERYAPVNVTGTTLEHVKGCDEAKDEMKEVIAYLKDPENFKRLGARLPHGVLLTGAPGTGKTLLARAVAGEANVPFIRASGSEFDESFVGVGANRVRQLFRAARRHKPCIVFIDELDAMAGKRSSADRSYDRQTVNQLLTELDGFDQHEGIFVIGATNLVEGIDSAMMRPGRFDKQMFLPKPDLQGRVEILDLYGKNLTLHADVSLPVLARRSVGMTGAELSNILNIAAIKAAAHELDAIPMNYLEEAFDRVIVGAARRSSLSEIEKQRTAYHESGHALVGIKTSGAARVHKATILPRGQALGVTWRIPTREDMTQQLYECEAELDVCMGGRAAELLVFGRRNVSSGCSDDLRKATQLARNMVMNFGMGGSDTDLEELAPMHLKESEYNALSDKKKDAIDTRVQLLLNEAHARASDVIMKHRGELQQMAEALVQFETLDAKELQLAIEGRMDELRSSQQRKIADMKASKANAEMARLRLKIDKVCRANNETISQLEMQLGQVEQERDPAIIAALRSKTVKIKKRLSDAERCLEQSQRVAASAAVKSEVTSALIGELQLALKDATRTSGDIEEARGNITGLISSYKAKVKEAIRSHQAALDALEPNNRIVTRSKEILEVNFTDTDGDCNTLKLEAGRLVLITNGNILANDVKDVSVEGRRLTFDGESSCTVSKGQEEVIEKIMRLWRRSEAGKAGEDKGDDYYDDDDNSDEHEYESTVDEDVDEDED